MAVGWGRSIPGGSRPRTPPADKATLGLYDSQPQQVYHFCLSHTVSDLPNDPSKAAEDFKKHKVSFADAEGVLEDPPVSYW